MLFSLVNDFAMLLAALPPTHERRALLDLLHEAVRRDVHFLARHPTTLFQCLWNACWWYDAPQAAAHYTLPPEHSGALPWEASTHPLQSHLESWRTLKEATTPGFVWLRSLRPPTVPLGSAQTLVLRGDISSDAHWATGEHIIATAGGQPRLWDTQTGAERYCLHGHTLHVEIVRFTPDGRHLLSRSPDDTVRLWDVASGQPEWCIDERGRGLAVLPDGRSFVVGSWYNQLRHRDRFTGAELRVIDVADESLSHVECSPDGQHVLCLTQFGNDIHIFDLLAGAEVRRLHGHEASVGTAVYAADGLRIASTASDMTVRIWDAATGQELVQWPSPSGYVGCLGFSPDGRLLAGGTAASHLYVWDATTGAVVRCFRGHAREQGQVQFSSCGRYLLSASVDGTARIWDMHKHGFFAELPHHNDTLWGRLRSLSFSPTHEQLVTCACEDVLLVWDTTTGMIQHRISLDVGHSDVLLGYPDTVGYTPDGQYLVSVESGYTQKVGIWDARTGAFQRAQIDDIPPIAPRGASNVRWQIDGMPDIQTARQLSQNGVTFLETTWSSPVTGHAVAWFPLPLQHGARHPTRNLWAGSEHNDLYLLMLEGDESQLHDERAN